MLKLDANQAQRLSELYHQRGCAAIARAISEAFPEASARAGERIGSVAEHAARSAAGFGVNDAACTGRLLACWVVQGFGFESRPEFAWALAILSDPQREQGAKAFQLSRRFAEELPAKPAAGMPDRDRFEKALAQLDRALLPIGVLGALVPGPRMRFGEPCDIDAFELGVIDNDWRREYRLVEGRWQRMPVRCEPAQWLLKGEGARRGGAGSSADTPVPYTVLSRDRDSPAALRMRLLASQTCDGATHPLVRLIDDGGVREWRGSATAQMRLALPSRPEAPPQKRLAPPIALEEAPRYASLNVETCGVRPSGIPIGRVVTWLAIYPARQHLLAWHREAAPACSWPLEGAPAETAPAPRCRIERDGEAVPAGDWLLQLAALDSALAEQLEGLVLSFERTSGVEQGRVRAQPAVMCGTSSLCWGWRDAAGVSGPPFMQANGTFDLRCALQLELSGQLRVGSSQGELLLSCPGVATLATAWARAQAQTDWISALKPVNLQASLPFIASYCAGATESGSLASLAGPVKGALLVRCGLRLHPGGGGLQWFCQLELEPLSVPLAIHDPLLGSELRTLPLLPKGMLLDWSLG